MNQTNKINWLLILQGWAMLWVVIGHSFLGEVGNGPVWENALVKFAYSFHMPLFMLVSGWLFYLTRLKSLDWGGQKWSYMAIVKDKALRLLLPGLVFSFVAFAVKLAFPGEMSRKTVLGIQEIVNAFLYPFNNPFREFWFVVTLYWFFILTPLWRWAIKEKWSMWILMAMLIGLSLIPYENELLCVGRVLKYSVWFYMGIVISKQDFVAQLKKTPIGTIVAGVVIYIIGGYVHTFVVTLGGIVFSFGIALIADIYIPKLFKGFRNYTYQIFLMGIFAQIVVKIAYRHIPIPYVAAYILCILAGLYVPVVVSKLIERVNWMPLLLCCGLKYKKIRKSFLK